MPIIRHEHNKENPFVLINKEGIRDKRLSAKARGLWAFMLSFPNDWNFSSKHLENSFPEGRRSIESGLKELAQHGYMIRLQFSKGGRGKDRGFQENIWMFFETPITKEYEKNILQ